MGLTFTRVDATISDAIEISAQGSNVYILRSDNSLWKLSGSTFVAKTSPPAKTLTRIQTVEVGTSNRVYACTADLELWRYYDVNTSWAIMTLSGPTMCSDVALGYGWSYSDYIIVNGATSSHNNSYDAWYRRADGWTWVGPLLPATRVSGSHYKIFLAVDDPAGFKMIYYTESSSSPIIRIDKTGFPSNSETDIANPTGFIAFYTYSTGGTYYL